MIVEPTIPDGWFRLAAGDSVHEDDKVWAKPTKAQNQWHWVDVGDDIPDAWWTVTKDLIVIRKAGS